MRTKITVSDTYKEFTAKMVVMSETTYVEVPTAK